MGESIRDSYDRKIRLLESSLNDYKTQHLKLKIVSEEYEENKQKYEHLKSKYNELMQQNVKFEPIQSELNEWKTVIREMCHNLLSNTIDLDNEYDLKMCLKELNESYIVLVKERDDCQSNMKLATNKYKECSKELNRLQIEIDKERKIKNDVLLKHKAVAKEAKDAKIDSVSYKNILNTYNVMSPSSNKNNLSLQIQKLYQENKGLNEKMKKLQNKIKEMEQEKSTHNEMMQTLENEKNALLERLNNGECDSLSTKVLSFKDNPLKLAMDRTKNEKIKKILAMESKIKKKKKIWGGDKKKKKKKKKKKS